MLACSEKITITPEEKITKNFFSTRKNFSRHFWIQYHYCLNVMMCRCVGVVHHQLKRQCAGREEKLIN